MSRLFLALPLLLTFLVNPSLADDDDHRDRPQNKNLKKRVERLESSVEDLQGEIRHLKGFKASIKERVTTVEGGNEAILETLNRLALDYSTVLDDLGALTLVVNDNQEQIVLLIEAFENGGGDDGEDTEISRADFCDSNYCTIGQGFLVYNYALSATPKTFPIKLPSDTFAFDFGRIPIYLVVNGIDFNNIPPECEADPGACYGEVPLEDAALLNEFLLNGQTVDIALLSQLVDDDFRAESPSIGNIQLRLTVDTGVPVDQYAPVVDAVTLYRPLQGTGDRASGTCTSTSLTPLFGGTGFAANITRSVSPDIIGGELRMFGIGPGFTGANVCSDTPPGTYELTFELVDGLGGKITAPITVSISEFFRDPNSENMLDLF